MNQPYRVTPSFVSKCSECDFKNLEVKRGAIDSKLLEKIILFLVLFLSTLNYIQRKSDWYGEENHMLYPLKQLY